MKRLIFRCAFPFLLGAALPFFASCSCNKENPVKKDEPEEFVMPVVHDYSNPDESGVSIVEYSYDTGQLIISTEPDEVPKVGEIICSDITDDLPYGMFMKVGQVIEQPSSKIPFINTYMIVSAEVSLYEFCQYAGITEAGWYEMIEKNVYTIDAEGNEIRKDDKVSSFTAKVEVEDMGKLEYKTDFSVNSLSLYLDATTPNVTVGCDALIKTESVLHATLEGSLFNKKGDLYKQFGFQEFVHVYKFPVSTVPIVITSKFKPKVPYELSLKAALDMDLYRNTQYTRFALLYNWPSLPVPRYKEKGFFFQEDIDPDKAPYTGPDNKTISATLDGTFSIGLEFEYSLGLFGGNLLGEESYVDDSENEDDETHWYEKDSWKWMKGLLSLGMTGGFKFQNKAKLGAVVEMEGDSHDACKVIDENKTTAYFFGQLWATLAKFDVLGAKVDIGAKTEEMKAFEVKLYSPFFFRYWKGLKVKSITRQGFLNINAKYIEPILNVFKERSYGFCIESVDAQDYWTFDCSDLPIDAKSGDISWDLPLHIDNLRTNIEYKLYPYSVITNFPFTDGDKMVCREGITFSISESGQITSSFIDDVPGEDL